jgi:hypothetical protein
MLGLGVIAVMVSMSYVDRPAAVLFNTYIRHSELWGWLIRLLAPFVLVPGEQQLLRPPQADPSMPDIQFHLDT